MTASLLKLIIMLAVFTVGGIVPESRAQVPDLEAMERQLEERKAEQAQQAARRAEEARRASDARVRGNQLEKVSDGVLDRQLNVVWAAADNGHDINWPDAVSYCRSLGAGWSLPSVSQLQSLGARDIRISSVGNPRATSLIRVHGLWLWSAEANGASEALGVVVDSRLRSSTRQSVLFGSRALCVRRP